MCNAQKIKKITTFLRHIHTHARTHASSFPSFVRSFFCHLNVFVFRPNLGLLINITHFAPSNLGLIAPDQAARYKQFGSWIKGCYDHPVASTPGPTSTAIVVLDMPTGSNSTAVDRVVLREDQTSGQQITAYKVEALNSVSGTWSTVASGQSIGNKAIRLFENATGVVATQFRFTATGFVDPSKPVANLLSFAVHKCDRSGNQTGCSYIKDTAFSYTPGMVLKTIAGSSANVCCSRCAEIPQCSVFILDPSNLCTLLSADGVRQPKPGYTSGTPNR